MKIGITQAQEMSEKENKLIYPRSVTSPGMVPSLEELSNLWAARFGDTWVKDAELSDEFWLDATERLAKKGYLEEMGVARQDALSVVTVYRLCK